MLAVTLTEDDNNYHLTKGQGLLEMGFEEISNTLSDFYEESLLLWPEH